MCEQIVESRFEIVNYCAQAQPNPEQMALNHLSLGDSHENAMKLNRLLLVYHYLCSEIAHVQ